MKQLAAIVIALLISVAGVEAQNTTTPAASVGTERSTLEIINRAEVAIVFDISCDQGNNWDAMTLPAGTNGTYYCMNPTTPPNLWFRLATQLPGQPRREVRGPLGWKSRNEIVWDQGLEMWFLRGVGSP